MKKSKLIKIILILLLFPFVFYNYTEPNSDLFLYIEELCKQYDIDTRLVVSIIEVESSFINRNHKSGNCIGLMQIKLNTAKDYLKNITKEELYIPKTNVLIGIKHLSYLNKLYRGDIVRIVNAYNIGQGDLRKYHRKDLINRNYFIKFNYSYYKVKIRED